MPINNPPRENPGYAPAWVGLTNLGQNPENKNLERPKPRKQNPENQNIECLAFLCFGFSGFCFRKNPAINEKYIVSACWLGIEQLERILHDHENLVKKFIDKRIPLTRILLFEFVIAECSTF